MTLPLDIEWPEALPLPRLDYNGEPVNGTLTSDRRAVFIERRSRFERSYNFALVQWVFTAEQFEAFKEFFADTLGNGTAQFKLELRFPLNSELTEWAVRIADGYAVVHVEGMWRVQAAIDILNPVVF